MGDISIFAAHAAAGMRWVRSRTGLGPARNHARHLPQTLGNVLALFESRVPVGLSTANRRKLSADCLASRLRTPVKTSEPALPRAQGRGSRRGQEP